MEALVALRNMFHNMVVLPVLGFLRIILPDIFDDYGPDSSLEFSTSPLVMDTPGLFSGANRLEDHTGDTVPGTTSRSIGLFHAGGPEAHAKDHCRDVGSTASHTPTEPGTSAQEVLVMRHGERQDMADTTWTSSAARPWDPPLSAFGQTQATDRGTLLASASSSITAVITSPFLRCIQTSAAVMKAAGLPPSCLSVDARVCEWMSRRNLNLGHISSDDQARMQGDVQQWFWGKTAQEGVRAAVSNAWCAEAGQQVRIRSLQFPQVGEAQEMAHARFQQAVASIAKAANGTVLVVTHGDAVGAVVEYIKPTCTVYQVDTAGYVALQWSAQSNALKIADASGVAWID